MNATARGSARRLSGVDRAWLRMERPTNLMMVNGVLLFDEPLDASRVRHVLETRLSEIPRFSQRIAPSRLDGRRHRWVGVDRLDLERHFEHTTLPPPGDDRALQAAVGELMSRPLDFRGPPWCFHLIDNYQGGSAIMGRVHHSIGDGIALMLVLLSMTDLEPGGQGAGGSGNPFVALLRGERTEQAIRQLEALLPGGMRLLTQPVESLKRSSVFARFVAASGAALRLALRSSDPKTLLKAPLGVDKRAVWSHPIPLEALKRNDVGLQATVNDLVLTAVTGGLRRYLERRGEAVEGLDLRAVVPVNLRPIEQMADLGNRFGVVFLSLPVGIADPLARLAEIRLRMRSLRRSAEPLASFGLLKLIGWAPYLVQRAAVRLFATKATAVMTNVPGPIRTLYLGGKPLRGIVFWVPQAGRVSLGVSICSYAGQVRVGIATDAGQVPDPSEIVEYFHDELGQLRRREPSPQTPDERKNA